MYDFANSAFATTILAVIYNRYYAGVVANGAQGVDVNLIFKTIHLHGTALFNFVVAIAMFFVAVSSPILGAWADGHSSRKKFLSIYLLLGIISTAMLSGVHAGEWLEGAIWFIIANVSFAGGNVFYNSFLKDIAGQDEVGKVSGWGWGIGYLGGGLLLLINLIMLQAPHHLGFPEGFFSVNHTFLTVSIWWGLFSLPLLINVKSRDLPTTSGKDIKNAFQRLKRSYKEIRKFKELWKFLLAYLLFNDGIETVIIMASIFGDQELKMSQSLLIGYFLMIQFTAFAGSFLFGRITVSLGNKRTLLISLYIWCAVVSFAYLIGWTGHPVHEYFVIGILAGMVMGASQSVARGIQTEFTPQGREAEFFGFFAVSGKFAALLGPLCYGLIVAITGSLRIAILSLVIFFILGIIILNGVNEDEGKRIAQTSLD